MNETATVERSSSFLDAHHGPFRLMLVRPFVTKPGFVRSQWLPGPTERDEVADEAMGYLTDPRDTVTAVHVWSQHEQQFVGFYRAGNRR